MKLFILISTLFVAFSMTLLGCSEPKPKETSSSSTSPVSGADSNTVLYLRIASKWENGGPGSTLDGCVVSSLSAQGEYTCSVSIPEGQLYYSDISFTYGTNQPALCAIISFQPYAYRRSSSGTYFPPREEQSVDCSRSDTTEKKCYGGAGPIMISDYPKNTAHYFLPTVTTEMTETLPSENTTRWYGGRAVNYLTTNNLSNRAANDPAREYVANSMDDYVLECLDIWAHPLYSIKLTISDQDTANGEGVEDEIDDWN